MNNPDPGPSSGLHGGGERSGEHEPRQTPAEPAGEINKPKDMRGQEVVALPIVPLKAGNRGRRDPLEGSGASLVQTH